MVESNVRFCTSNIYTHINRVVEPDCYIVVVVFILAKCVFEWSNTINCCGCWRVLILSLQWHHRQERMITKLKLKAETSGRILGAATVLDSFKRTHQAHWRRRILTFCLNINQFFFFFNLEPMKKSTHGSKQKSFIWWIFEISTLWFPVCMYALRKFCHFQSFSLKIGFNSQWVGWKMFFGLLMIKSLHILLMSSGNQLWWLSIDFVVSFAYHFFSLKKCHQFRVFNVIEIPFLHFHDGIKYRKN